MAEEKSSLAPGRTWIDTHLNPAETERLVNDLMEMSSNPTALEIQALVREMKGTAPSERSCLEWKKVSYFPFYLRARRQLADKITAMQTAGSNVPAATAALLRQKNFDLMLEAGDNPKILGLISTIQARLDEADQNALRIAQGERDLASKIEARDAVIKNYERKAEEWREARAKATQAMDRLQKKGGLSEEGRRELDEYLNPTEAA